MNLFMPIETYDICQDIDFPWLEGISWSMIRVLVFQSSKLFFEAIFPTPQEGWNHKILERERERNRDIAISSFSFYHFILPSTSFYPFISELSFALGCLLLLLHMFTLAQGLPIILDWASAVIIILDCVFCEITVNHCNLCRHRKQKGRRQILKAPWGKEWSSSIWIDVHQYDIQSHHFSSS